MTTARKPTRQGILDMIRRGCLLLICIAAWAAAIAFGFINAKPYSAFFAGFGLSLFIAQIGAWGTWAMFQLIQMYPSFVQNKAGARWYKKVSFIRNIAFAAETVIQYHVHLPGGVFSLPLPELGQAVITILGTVFAAAGAIAITMIYTDTWGSESPLHGRTVNTSAREA